MKQKRDSLETDFLCFVSRLSFFVSFFDFPRYLIHHHVLLLHSQTHVQPNRARARAHRALFSSLAGGM